MAVYSDYEGEPNDRLAVTAQTAVNSDSGWQEMTSFFTITTHDIKIYRHKDFLVKMLDRL